MVLLLGASVAYEHLSSGLLLAFEFRWHHVAFELRIPVLHLYSVDRMLQVECSSLPARYKASRAHAAASD